MAKTNVIDFIGWLSDQFRFVSEFINGKLDDRKEKSKNKKEASAELKKVEKEAKDIRQSSEKRDEKLTKTKLALRLSDECDLEPNDAREFLNAFFTAVKETFASYRISFVFK